MKPIVNKEKKQQSITEDALITMMERIMWQTATRNDEEVACYLYEQHKMDSVYGLDEAVLFDYLFNYLEEIGYLKYMRKIEPRRGEIKRSFLPFYRYVQLYLMRCIAGIEAMFGCQELLFSDERAMKLAGFNGHQVRYGTTARGLARRKTPIGEFRGAIHYETVVNNLVKLNAGIVDHMLNHAISCLAAHGTFPKKIHAVLDATDLETTDRCMGCGSVKREREVTLRGSNKKRKISVMVYGFKMWAVFDPKTEIPLGITIDTIEKPDNTHAYSVFEKAEKNLAGHASIASLVIDRGFLDGKLLYALSETKKIELVIPAKKNMDVTKDVITLSEQLLHASPEVVKERTCMVNHGQGKMATAESITTQAIAINDLTSATWFNPKGSGSHTNAKSFTPLPIHAVHITKWNNHEQDDDKAVVLLTNKRITDPFTVIDRYANRSLIENQLFREAKQAWFLEQFPRKTREGVTVHAYLTFTVMALTRAFRNYQYTEGRAELKGQETGMRRYRRKIKSTNRDKLIVFVNDTYGIFYTHEAFILAGIDVSQEMADLHISRRDVLLKYCPNHP